MKKSTYQFHSMEEINAISEEEYVALRNQALSVAKELGISDIDRMELPELETRIKLRNTPMNKIGYTLSLNTTKEKKPINSLWTKLTKFKKEIITTLRSYADGYVKYHKALKVYDVDGVPMLVTGIFGEFDIEDGYVLKCNLKGIEMMDSEYVHEEYEPLLFIEASDLSLNSLLHLVNELEDGNATIYSKEEVDEINYRKPDFLI